MDGRRPRVGDRRPRDAVRHFTVDNDRVFLIGVGDGANMAMDVGMSHRTCSRALIAMGPVPGYVGYFDNYWSNAQSFPVFVVTGEMIGDGIKSLRLIYEKWMLRGYPSAVVGAQASRRGVVRGRSADAVRLDGPQGARLRRRRC